MDIDKFIADFSEALEELPSEPLEPSTEYKQLKTWDSLAVLTVIDAVDMEYSVLLKKEDFAQCVTLQELFDFVQQKQG